MRLADALEKFVVQLQADGRSANTIAQYRRHVVQLSEWLARESAGEELDELGHETLALFLASADARQSRHGRARRPTTVNCLRSSLRAFFTYVHEAGWTASNPARLIRRARCGGPAPRGLSDQDRAKLLAALIVAQGPEARRDHLLVDLMLSTGIRLSAALALTDADVDLDGGELLVHHAKGDRVERVILGRDIRDHLVGYLAEREPGPMFPGKDGRPMVRRHAVRRLAVWMQRAGCQRIASPHALRHDFATRLYRKTGDVLLVQRALGHRSIASTVVYAGADVGALRAALSS